MKTPADFSNPRTASARLRWPHPPPAAGPHSGAGIGPDPHFLVLEVRMSAEPVRPPRRAFSIPEFVVDAHREWRSRPADQRFHSLRGLDAFLHRQRMPRSAVVPRDFDISGHLLRHLPAGWRNPAAYDLLTLRVRPGGLYASDRDVWMFFVSGGDVLDLGRRDRLHRGFFVWNSEPGDKDFGWSTFYFRRVCANHIVWEPIEKRATRSRAGDRDTVWRTFQEFVAALGHPADHRPFVAAVTAAKEQPIGEPDDPGAAQRLVARGFRPAEIAAAGEAMRDEEAGATGTAWDWLQGFTAAARSIPHAARRVELERHASRVLLQGAAIGTETREENFAFA